MILRVFIVERKEWLAQERIRMITETLAKQSGISVKVVPSAKIAEREVLKMRKTSAFILFVFRRDIRKAGGVQGRNPRHRVVVFTGLGKEQRTKNGLTIHELEKEEDILHAIR